MGVSSKPYVPPAQSAAEIKAEQDKTASQNKQAVIDDLATRKQRVGRSSLVDPGLFIPPTQDPTPGPVVPQIATPVAKPNPFHVPAQRRITGINALADPSRGRGVDSLYIP